MRETVVTHAERVVDLDSGVTKGQLASYAQAMVPHFLPFAVKRPLMLVRCTGDILAFSPPLIVNEQQIDHLFGTVAEALKETA